MTACWLPGHYARTHATFTRDPQQTSCNLQLAGQHDNGQPKGRNFFHPSGRPASEDKLCSNMASELKVLISGAGIAGPIAAYFLAKTGAQVTIVERSRIPRRGGQAVDVRGHGLTILQRMNLEEAARTRSTREAGLKFVNSQDQSSADFPVGSGNGFTGQIEIMRGELAHLLYEATKHDVQYFFGESIREMQEDCEGVTVMFQECSPRRFDIVIGADGWSSTTRRLAFGADVSAKAVRSLEQWAAWYTIPQDSGDDHWAKWYTAPGRRMILTRPTSGLDHHAGRGVSLWFSTTAHDLDDLARAPMPEQKDHWHKLFCGMGWKEEMILSGILKADNFYMQKIAQVKMDHLSLGRIVLVGDAGSCPCPISGMGTTISLVGAYVLAGELATTPHNHRHAFEAYEAKLRPFVDRAQVLAPCAPGMVTFASPRSIELLHLVIRMLAWTGIVHLVAKWFNPPARAMKLPLYHFPRGHAQHLDSPGIVSPSIVNPASRSMDCRRPTAKLDSRTDSVNSA